MRTLAFALAALLVGSASAEARQRSGGPPVLEAPRGTGAISGVVIDATTGKPVEGAIVGLGVTTGGQIINRLPRVITDPKGRFLFPDLPPRTDYYIRASRVGYAPSRFGSPGPRLPSDRVSDLEIMTTDDTVKISLAADQWISDLPIRIWRLGNITGRIIDERGEPVVGAAVRAFSSVLVAGHDRLAGTDVAATDDRGEYRLGNLMPGKYFVSVLSVQQTVLDSTPEGSQRRAIGELVFVGGSNPGVPTVDVDGTHRIAISNFATPPPPSSTAARAYAAQFYPGTQSLSGARAIDITYGSSRRGVDFQLQPVPAVKVSGRLVAEEDGAADASSLMLRLMPAGSEKLGGGSEAATTIVERDGSFTFLNVPSGEYTLLAQAVFGDLSRGIGEVTLPDAPGFSAGSGQAVTAMNLSGGLNYSSHSNKTGMWARATVVVGASNVTDLVVPMHRPITVRGRIVIAGGSPLRYGTDIVAQPANGDPSLGRISNYLVINGPTPFTLEGLGSGTYLLGFASFSNQIVTVASITTGGREIRDTGLDTSSGRDVDDVVITLYGPESLTTTQGTVRGDGAAGAAVIVFPVARARWIDYGMDPLLIRSRAADSSGAFVFSGFPEGEYFAVAVDGLLHDAWRDPQFLEAASVVATRFSLKTGEKKSLDLPISKVVVK